MPRMHYIICYHYHSRESGRWQPTLQMTDDISFLYFTIIDWFYTHTYLEASPTDFARSCFHVKVLRIPSFKANIWAFLTWILIFSTMMTNIIKQSSGFAQVKDFNSNSTWPIVSTVETMTGSKFHQGYRGSC